MGKSVSKRRRKRGEGWSKKTYIRGEGGGYEGYDFFFKIHFFSKKKRRQGVTFVSAVADVKTGVLKNIKKNPQRRGQNEIENLIVRGV